MHMLPLRTSAVPVFCELPSVPLLPVHPWAFAKAARVRRIAGAVLLIGPYFREYFGYLLEPMPYEDDKDMRVPRCSTTVRCFERTNRPCLDVEIDRALQCSDAPIERLVQIAELGSKGPGRLDGLENVHRMQSLKDGQRHWVTWAVRTAGILVSAYPLARRRERFGPGVRFFGI